MVYETYAENPFPRLTQLAMYSHAVPLHEL